MTRVSVSSGHFVGRVKATEAAAKAMGLELQVFEASTHSSSQRLPNPCARGTSRMTEMGPRRRQLAALIFSGVFPGIGQFYNRQPTKGVAFLVAGIVLSWLLGRSAPTDLEALAQPGAMLLVLLSTLLVIWLWSLVDAWQSARR